MTVRNGFRIVAGALVFVLLVGTAAAVAWTAYNAGVAQGAAGDVQPSVPPLYAPYVFHPYGFGLLGCLAPLALLFFGLGFVRLVFWGGMGEHRHWRGPMHGHWREMAEDWHRREHAAEKEGPSQGGSPAA
jgi:hypothetical protein